MGNQAGAQHQHRRLEGDLLQGSQEERRGRAAKRVHGPPAVRRRPALQARHQQHGRSGCRGNRDHAAELRGGTVGGSQRRVQADHEGWQLTTPQKGRLQQPQQLLVAVAHQRMCAEKGHRRRRPRGRSCGCSGCPPAGGAAAGRAAPRREQLRKSVLDAMQRLQQEGRQVLRQRSYGDLPAGAGQTTGDGAAGSARPRGCQGRQGALEVVLRDLNSVGAQLEPPSRRRIKLREGPPDAADGRLRGQSPELRACKASRAVEGEPLEALSGGTATNLARRPRPVASQHLQDLKSLLRSRWSKAELAVKAPRSPQSCIQQLRPVGRAEDGHAATGHEAVHEGQERGHHGVVVSRAFAAGLAARRREAVNLVKEDDRGCVPPCSLEEGR
mmetsp:Transcript_15517/g.49695  ORF Transcript_15517/g.49695 Transcript_15517/m.49695 type:complete len:385 (+) Transcript_15517:1394-2548(+)